MIACYGMNNVPQPLSWASLVAQSVKNLAAMQETHVWLLGWGNPLEKEMATHSSILAGESHGQRSLVGYSSCGSQESDTTEQLNWPNPQWDHISKYISKINTGHKGEALIQDWCQQEEMEVNMGREKEAIVWISQKDISQKWNHFDQLWNW